MNANKYDSHPSRGRHLPLYCADATASDSAFSPMSRLLTCTHAQPSVSVVVPVYNGAGFLDRCLTSLRLSDTDDFECIVVDDGSTDSSAAVAARHGATVLPLDSRGGPAHARNRGADLARGEVLLFLDADVCPHPDTVRRMSDHLASNPQAQAVMGSYDDAPADPHFVAQYKNLLHHFVHQQSRTDAWTFWAGCGAVRRSAFQQIGGFDESYARPCIEDIELGMRMHARGWRLDLNPTIQVTHLKRWTVANLLRTDIRDRAIPWLLLMLRRRSMPADLNVTLRHRISVAITNLTLLALLVSLVAPPLRGAVATASLGTMFALVGLNADFYTFLRRKRGLWFTVRALPLHWLYYLYCGLAVVVALAQYAIQEKLGGKPTADLGRF